jgi:hypothetical protein
VVLFGKQVSDVVIKHLQPTKISTTTYQHNTTTFILADHPSYITVYKRASIQKYIEQLIENIQR